MPLETLAGACRVQEALRAVRHNGGRFDQVGIEVVQAALNAAERRPAGRPALALSPAEDKNQQLWEHIAQLEAQLQAALIEAELAVTCRRRDGDKKNVSE